MDHSHCKSPDTNHLFFIFNFFSVTSHQFVELLLFFVLDCSWFWPGVSKPGWNLCSALAFCNDPQSQLWIPGLGLAPILHLEATTGVTTQCHFWDGYQIQTHGLTAQSPTLYRLSCPGQLWYKPSLCMYKWLSGYPATF